MKKKIISLLLCACMVLSLAACSECSHEWADPTCTTAATCSKCGETSGEALGHSWQEATCSAPETCYNCGETQGEALPHTYGAWEFGKTDMSRACTVCGETETAALDREAMFRELIVGNWDEHSTSGPYGSTDTYSTEGLRSAMQRQLIIINEPDRAEYWVYSIKSGMDLIYLGYEKQNDSDVYKLRCEFDDGSGMDAMLIHNDEGDFFSLSMVGTGYVMFSRNDELEQLLPGRYVCGEDYIELHSDRRVTGNIGGEVEGYWVLKPVISTDTGYIFGINVNAERGSLDDIDDSDPENTDYTASAASDWTVFLSHDNFLIGQSIEELENFSHDKISINFTEEGVVFLPEGVAVS